MKKKLLFGIYLTLFLLTSYSGNSQGIKFERVLPAPPAPQITVSFEGVEDSSIAFADVNGDGYPDVLITGYASVSNQQFSELYTNDGKGNFTEVATPFEGVGLSSVAFADIDGDGDQDVLITGRNNSNQSISKLYTNDGKADFTEVLGTPFEGVSLGSIAFANINADHFQDVLITGCDSS
jgi:hypothetical protein